MRARNIKPGFFKNDELAECSLEARIVFQGLWCMADREGRLKDRPKRIKAEALPYDDADPEAMLCELSRAGFIVRYEVKGERFIHVVNFLEHQKPHQNEKESDIPPLEEGEVWDQGNKCLLPRQQVLVNGKKDTSRNGYSNQNSTNTSGKTIDKLKNVDGDRKTQRQHNQKQLDENLNNHEQKKEPVKTETCNTHKRDLLPRQQVLATKETSDPADCGFLNPDRGMLNPDRGMRNEENTNVEFADAKPDVAVRGKPKKQKVDRAKEVFVYWQEKLNHPKAKLDKKRRRKINDRLKEKYTVEDLKQAVDGCSLSPHHMGENKTGTIYDDLGLICRDASHVDKFIKQANAPPGRAALSASGRKTASAADPWIARKKGEMEENAKRGP